MIPAAATIVMLAATQAATPTAAAGPSKVGPPKNAPVNEVVGGKALGTIGAPLADPAAPPLPGIDGGSWLVADADTGEVLAAYNAHQRRPPASTIKLLTAIATAPLLDPKQEYVATAEDQSVVGSRVGLVESHTYTVGQLFYGLLLPSGNDAAHAIAEAAGGQDKTVALMNEEARKLGAFDTHARTPHGLDRHGQLTSAYDLALIGRHALADKRIRNIVGTTAYDFPNPDGSKYEIDNTNQMLGVYDGAIGLKTGYTSEAEHTFVGAAERDGRTLIATVMGADGRGEEGAAALFDWAFSTPGAKPVGRLVSPADVTTMVAAQTKAEAAAKAKAKAEANAKAKAKAEGKDRKAAAGQQPSDKIDRMMSEQSDNDGGVPPAVWLILFAGAIAGAIGFVVRRPSRSGGRHSADRS